MRRLFLFIGSIKAELIKVSWPWSSDVKSTGVKKYQPLINSTIIVLVALTLVGAYIALWDVLLKKACLYIINLFS